MEGTLRGSIADVLEGQISGSIDLLAGEPILDNITITENGHYTPPSGVDGYDDITVNVPSTQPVLDDITINENGHYTPPSGVDGYDDITVYVPYVSQGTTINENGTYTPPSGVDGFDRVIVDVPNAVQGLVVTENGTYTAPVGSGVVGYSPVTVNVTPPPPVISTLNATHNGTFYPPTGIDGFDEVIVDVPTKTLIEKNIYKDGIYLPSDDNVDGYSKVNVEMSTLIGGVDGYNEIGIVNTTTLENLILRNVVQSSMTVTVINGTGITVAWNGSSNIGVSLGGNLNMNKCHKIKYTMVVYDTYYRTHQQDIYKIRIGVRRNKASANWNDFLVVKAYGVDNTTIEDEIDISEVTGDFYLGMILSGCNLNITKLEFE